MVLPGSRGLRSIWPAVITFISILLVIINRPLLNADYGVLIALLLLLSAALCHNLPQNLYTAAGFFLFALTGVRLQHALMQATPVTLDPLFRSADLALGFDTVWLWHALAAHRALLLVLDIAYAYLPVAMALTWIAEQNRAYRRAALIAGIACFGFYLLFPAAGPGFYDWKTGMAYGWRNCMPSMHLTWAILAARYARREPLRSVLWATWRWWLWPPSDWVSTT